jgi:hypothetical protein
VGREWDDREQGELQVAYRAHLREMTAARQAAERARGVRSRDPEVRRATEAAFGREMARIAQEHQAWLRDHALVDPPEGGRHRL